MRSVYIVGAQCTGKTTLSRAVERQIKEEHPQLKVELVNEIARPTLEKFNINRDDIRNDPERCYLLQKLILKGQHQRETEVSTDTVMVSDRSGVDPLAYASLLLDDKSVKELCANDMWTKLRERMKEAAVILCEPVEDWLFDDGVRLMPIDIHEWRALHYTFCQLLDQYGVPYRVVPCTLRDLSARVSLVLSTWACGPEQNMGTKANLRRDTGMGMVGADDPKENS